MRPFRKQVSSYDKHDLFSVSFVENLIVKSVV